MDSDEGIPVIGASPPVDARSHTARPRWSLAVVAAVGVALVASVALSFDEPDRADEITPDLAPPDDPRELGIESSQVAPGVSVVDGPGWYPEFAVPLPTGTAPHLVGLVSAGGAPHVVTTVGVFELQTSGAGVTLSDARPAPDLEANSVSISAVGFGGSPVQVYPGIGGWTGRSRALERVAAVGVSAGDGTGPYVVSVGESGRWEVTSDLPRLLYVTRMIDGVFVGQQLLDGMPAGDAVFSGDGERWQPIPGWRVEQAVGAGAVLASNADPTVIAVPTDLLPEVDPITAPTERPITHALLVGDGIVAVDEMAAHFFSPEDGWTSRPLDNLHGAALPVLPLTVDPPRIVFVADGLLVVSTWSE